MPVIQELATLTSKGQITLPKSIRQALGADAGSLQRACDGSAHSLQRRHQQALASLMGKGGSWLHQQRSMGSPAETAQNAGSPHPGH